MMTDQNMTDEEERAWDELERKQNKKRDTTDIASGGLTVDVTDLINRAIAEERRNLAGHYLAIMRDAVEQAVKREREACAKLCDEIHKNWHQTGVRECAESIRGRTE
jgi:hypothetical protein